MVNCKSVMYQYPSILSQVSLSVATCQLVQSSDIPGAALLGSWTAYAVTRYGTVANLSRVEERIMLETRKWHESKVSESWMVHMPNFYTAQ